MCGGMLLCGPGEIGAWHLSTAVTIDTSVDRFHGGFGLGIHKVNMLASFLTFFLFETLSCKQLNYKHCNPYPP